MTAYLNFKKFTILFEVYICTRAALMRCSRLNAPSNEKVVTVSGDDPTELVVGSTAHYSCNSGYALAESDQLVCINNRGGVKWNGNLPTCMKVYLLIKEYTKNKTFPNVYGGRNNHNSPEVHKQVQNILIPRMQ